MNLIELIVVSTGLSMDALAVAVCKGLVAGKTSLKQCILTGLYFGFFQALMPLTGFLLGSGFSDRITETDHWIAFLLLTVIGSKMLLDARGAADSLDASFSLRSMLPLAVATSIDALAMGAGFAFLNLRILPTVSLIGLITFSLSALGVRLGSLFGNRFRAPAQRTGGLILLLMGAKILLDHLNTP